MAARAIGDAINHPNVRGDQDGLNNSEHVPLSWQRDPDVKWVRE
jgi:hypothetical protein